MRKLTKETLADSLNGREKGEEMDGSEEIDARDSGLLVCFGASDDLLELRGAVYDEVDAYEGTTVRIDTHGVQPTWDDPHEEKSRDEAANYFKRQGLPFFYIDAVWCDKNDPEKHAWNIKTAAPHAQFSILEDGEPFCRGVVLDLDATLQEIRNSQK